MRGLQAVLIGVCILIAFVCVGIGVSMFRDGTPLFGIAAIVAAGYCLYTGVRIHRDEIN